MPQRIAGERAKELRELAMRKGAIHRARRAGQMAEVVLEGDEGWALTEDYLRVKADPRAAAGVEPGNRLYTGRLREEGEHLYIDLSQDPVN